MNEMFLKMTGFLVVALLLIICGGAAVLVHLAFLASRWRGQADAGYRSYITKWFLRRALPLALLLSFILLLLAIIPASLLAWYRTGTIHQLSTRHLLLRVYDEVAIPNSGGDSDLVERVSHSTTNSTEIAEFLAAIRFSPTYPNYGCLCSGGGRKFELVWLRKGVKLRPIETFTIHHDESIRFENDWYGDWHLWGKSQADLAAWQQKYIPVSQSSTNDAASTHVPAASHKGPSSGQPNSATELRIHPGTEETR